MGAGGSNKYNGVTMQPTTRLPESQHMVYSVDGHPLARRSDLRVLVEYAIRNGTAWRFDNAVKNGDAVECEDCPYAMYDRRPRSESVRWTCTLEREDAPQCSRLNLVSIASDEAEDVLGLDLTDPWIRTHWAAIVADVIHRVINPQSTPATAHASGSLSPRPRHVMDRESDDVRHHYPIMLDVAALMTDADAVGVLAANGETVRTLPEVEYV